MPEKKKKTATKKPKNENRRAKLGSRIKHYRKELGYSNGLDFSVDNHIPYSQYARWEAGRANLTFDSLCLLADAMGISVSKLTEGI